MCICSLLAKLNRKLMNCEQSGPLDTHPGAHQARATPRASAELQELFVALSFAIANAFASLNNPAPVPAPTVDYGRIQSEISSLAIPSGCQSPGALRDSGSPSSAPRPAQVPIASLEQPAPQSAPPHHVSMPRSVRSPSPCHSSPGVDCECIEETGRGIAQA
jgi:hypothetical protein